MVGAAASGLTTSGQSLFAVSLYAALVNLIGLTLFIYSAAPVSGGHLKCVRPICIVMFARKLIMPGLISPSITIATCLAGLATVPRAILYIVAQSTGAIVGAYWLRLGLGDAYFPIVRALASIGRLTC